MTRKDKDLDNPENWDLENAAPQRPVKGRRAIVSVAFPAEELALVANMARLRGMKLSEFIRESATEKARGTGAVATGAMFQFSTATLKEPVLVEEEIFLQDNEGGRKDASRTEAVYMVKEIELLLT